MSLNPDMMSPPPHSTSWATRTFSPIRAGSIRGSILALVTTAMGAGVLTTPFALSQTGMLLGLILLVAAGLVGMLTTYILIVAVKMHNAVTYSDIVAKTLGKNMGLVVDMLSSILGMGTSLSYLVFLGDFMPSAMSQLPVPHILTQRTTIIILCAAVCFLLSTPAKLSALRNFQFLPIFAIVCTTLAVVLKAPDAHTETAAAGFEPVYFNIGWSALAANSIFIFAFMQHLNVCAVADEMMNPTDPRIFKVCARAAAVEILCYLPVALFGYLSFMGSVKQNVVQNYTDTDKIILLCRVCMGCALLVTCPMNTIATGKAIRGLLRSKFGARTHTQTHTTNPSHLEAGMTEKPHVKNSPRLGDSQETGTGMNDSDRQNSAQQLGVIDARPKMSVSDSETRNSRPYFEGRNATTPTPLPPQGSSGALGSPLGAPLLEERPQHDDVFESAWVRVLCVGCVLGIDLGIALVVNSVADVVSLLGGVFGTTIMVVFPAAVYEKTLAQRHSVLVRWGVRCVCVVYALAGYVATFAVLLGVK